MCDVHAVTSALISLPPTCGFTRESIDAFFTRHPEWPIPGVCFINVLPLWSDARAVTVVLDAIASAIIAEHARVDFIAVIEARWFLLSAVATRLGLPFVCVRKMGKLPPPVVSREYALEYGTATIEVSRSAVAPGSRGILIDDLLATGGTLAAAASLLREMGAEVLGAAVLVELEGLGGRARAGLPILTLTRA